MSYIYRFGLFISKNCATKVAGELFFFHLRSINGMCFENFACGAENLTKSRSFKCFGRSRKMNLLDLKKDRQNL